MLKKKPQTVSERITELIARDVEHSSDSDEAQEAPRVEQEFDEYDIPDTRSTDIRKRNVKLLAEQSVRYRGKITSRSELEQDSDIVSEDDSDVETSDDAEALQAYNKQMKKQSYNNNNANDSDEEEEDIDEESENDADEQKSGEEEHDGDDDDDDDGDDSDESVDEEDELDEDEDANDIIAESNRQAEIQKGQCVQNQLRIWERLLELRMHSHKLLSKANQLPAVKTLQTLSNEHETLAQARNSATVGLSTLLNSMLQLQNNLCAQFPEQRSALKQTLKRQLPVTNEESSEELPLKRFATHLATHFEELRPYRNAVLLKWEDRTKLLVPGAGAKRKSLADEFDVVKKIESVLQQRSALIKRSQVLKTANEQQQQLSKAADEVDKLQTNGGPLNVEIYDDSDFYHQQLRELIEHKTNSSVNASELTQQYVELQKLRQKMKKNVDQRASKGRKLRYTVHNKLVNFMAPDDTTTWTDESKDELYKSLFAA